MAIIGQGVQAGLGRIDYSPYMQGAVSGAQSIAQGLASLGQNVAKGIEAYTLKQEKKKQEAAATDMVAGIFKANPFLAKSFNLPTDQNGEFDKGALKEFIKVSGGPGQAVQLASGLDQMNRARQQQEKELADRARLEQFLTQTPAGAAIAGGARFESLPVGAEAFLPRQFGNAQELLVAGQRAGIPITQLLPVATGMASLGKTEAEAAALRTPKPEKAPTGTEALYQSRRQAFIEKNNRTPTAVEDAEIRQGSIEAGRAQSTTNIGTGFAGQLFTDLNKKKSDIFALREVLANYDTAIDEVSKGGISGPGGEIKFQGARALQAFGINAFKSEAEAYQAAGSALAASALSMARMLPGSFTEKELVFLNNVVSGAEKVPSLDALKQLRSRFASRLERQEKVFESEVNAFGEASKEDPNIKIGFRILSAKPSASMPSLPPNF